MLSAKQALVDAVKLGLTANTEQLRQVGACGKARWCLKRIAGRKNRLGGSTLPAALLLSSLRAALSILCSSRFISN